MSVGVATIASGDTPASIVERADKALYEAKAGGRNSVRIARVQAPTEPPDAAVQRRATPPPETKRS